MTDMRSRLNTHSGRGERPLAPLVAIIGSDGAGKTTVAAHLCSSLAGEGAVYAYLGLGTGTIGLKIQAWPLIGPAVSRRLAAKATQARTKGEKIPGVFTALTIYGFSLLRVRRFRQMQALRDRTSIVICDRYPQVDVPGFYDGPGLNASTPTGRFTAWLAKREFALYQSMVSHLPTLVIRLNIDAETAFSRKPDHNLSLLQQKVQATSSLRFNNAKIIDVDASQPLERVQAICAQLIRQLLINQQNDATRVVKPSL
jgi:thymidylate kinase